MGTGNNEKVNTNTTKRNNNSQSEKEKGHLPLKSKISENIFWRKWEITKIVIQLTETTIINLNIVLYVREKNEKSRFLNFVIPKEEFIWKKAN